MVLTLEGQFCVVTVEAGSRQRAVGVVSEDNFKHKQTRDVGGDLQRRTENLALNV